MDKKKLESRVAKTKADARKNLARREKLNIRFSETEIGRIFEAAGRNNTRVMPMLRSWVMAALENDEASLSNDNATVSYPSVAENTGMVREPTHSDSLLILMNRLADLEIRVQMLEYEKRPSKPSKKTE